ncbi:MAG TPA: oxygenase MpaB family protein [Kofleriaceae bacterium]|nr:oxygenase MpaB family protein [Kofleriaceae bacterium]
MTTNHALELKVHAQRERIPAMYGQIDFSRVPERFTDDPADASSLPARLRRRRARLLQNGERVAMLRAYTMLGDLVADAYAALLPQYGGRQLVGMLQEACAKGVEHVPNAPPELVAFIREMERMPAWLDRSLIEEGARRQRNAYANVAPFAIRGAFFATFMNKYSALPMAITGALTNATAARRVKETATFFTTSVLPGALERFGEGFRAAAMVRLMHSLVRYNVLARRSDWDVRTHGIPIPQVDQMPAGLINVFLLARQVLRQGRTTFTRDERAIVELSRYRCFLLGLPEELLADTPQEITDLMLTRAATLRDGFEDATCGALVRATMAAEISRDPSLIGRLEARMERSFAKLFFMRNFVDGDRSAAARVGIDITPVDYAVAAATTLWIMSHVHAYAAADRIPILRDLADARLVQKLRKQLASFGHAEYTTKSESYRPDSHRPAQPAAAH